MKRRSMPRGLEKWLKSRNHNFSRERSCWAPCSFAGGIRSTMLKKSVEETQCFQDVDLFHFPLQRKVKQIDVLKALGLLDRLLQHSRPDPTSKRAWCPTTT